MVVRQCGWTPGASSCSVGASPSGLVRAVRTQCTRAGPTPCPPHAVRERREQSGSGEEGRGGLAPGGCSGKPRVTLFVGFRRTSPAERARPLCDLSQAACRWVSAEVGRPTPGRSGEARPQKAGAGAGRGRIGLEFRYARGVQTVRLPPLLREWVLGAWNSATCEEYRPPGPPLQGVGIGSNLEFRLGRGVQGAPYLPPWRTGEIDLAIPPPATSARGSVVTSPAFTPSPTRLRGGSLVVG